MRSVADDVREKHAAEVRAMTPGHRVQLAFKLGERDLAVFMAARGITSREEAIRLVGKVKRAGRRPSGCMNT
jgi:uncharacterized protein YoaH (UPF0181 family)